MNPQPSFLFILVLFNLSVFAQPADTLGNIYDDLKAELDRKNEGTVYLKNGSTLTGFVDYRSYNNSLTVSVDKRDRALAPTNVSRFEYFDVSQSKNRKFISRDYEGMPTFFEILKDYGEFSVVVQNIPAEAETQLGPRDSYDRYGLPDNSAQRAILRTRFTEATCLFFKDKIHHYSHYVTTETDNLSGRGLMGSRRKVEIKIVDKDLMKNLMGDKLKAVKKFASKNNLHWSDKNELLLILDYFAGLR